MKNIKTIDFTTETSSINFLKEISNKKEIITRESIRNIKNEEDLIKLLEINLNAFEIKEAEINFIHITTQIDDLAFLKNSGLLDTVEMLKIESSPFNQFLLNNGIRLDISNHTLIYNNRTYTIERTSYPNHDKSINALYTKLYSNMYRHVNGFYFSKSTLEYGCVKKHPELLEDIQDILRIPLCLEWEKMPILLQY